MIRSIFCLFCVLGAAAELAPVCETGAETACKKSNARTGSSYIQASKLATLQKARGAHPSPAAASSKDASNVAALQTSNGRMRTKGYLDNLAGVGHWALKLDPNAGLDASSIRWWYSELELGSLAYKQHYKMLGFPHGHIGYQTKYADRLYFTCSMSEDANDNFKPHTTTLYCGKGASCKGHEGNGGHSHVVVPGNQSAGRKFGFAVMIETTPDDRYQATCFVHADELNGWYKLATFEHNQKKPDGLKFTASGFTEMTGAGWNHLVSEGLVGPFYAREGGAGKDWVQARHITSNFQDTAFSANPHRDWGMRSDGKVFMKTCGCRTNGSDERTEVASPPSFIGELGSCLPIKGPCENLLWGTSEGSAAPGEMQKCADKGCPLELPEESQLPELLLSFNADVVSKLVLNVHEDCFEACNSQTGACPDVCGERGACCAVGQENPAECLSEVAIKAFHRQHGVEASRYNCIPVAEDTTATMLDRPTWSPPTHLITMPSSTRCRKTKNIANTLPRGVMKGNIGLNVTAETCQQRCLDEETCRFATHMKTGICTAYTECKGTASEGVSFWQKSKNASGAGQVLLSMAEESRCNKKTNIANIAPVGAKVANLGLKVTAEICQERCLAQADCAVAVYGHKKGTCTAHTKCRGIAPPAYLAWEKVDAGQLMALPFTMRSKLRWGDYGAGQGETKDMKEEDAEEALLQAADHENEEFLRQVEEEAAAAANSN